MSLWTGGVGNGIAAAYVFASLDSQSNTTITTAGTYYPISGTFTNDPIVGFTTVADPAIQKTTTGTHYFEVDWSATLSGDSSAMTANCAIKKNGTLVSPSVMGSYLKTANESQAVSGTAVVSLAKDDKIQLVVTADGDGDVVTFYHFTTTIRIFS